jgi:choline dehydrogenase-like flavoprotein
VLAGGLSRDGGAIYCVGGPSVFFGGAAVRLRVDDFAPDQQIAGASGARWPFDYAELEPYYAEAERVIGVSGDDSEDPTRPPRSAPYPFVPPPLAAVSIRFREAARSLGLSPFRLPLAINTGASNGRRSCDSCRACDTYACSIGAKNDMAVAVLLPLMERGLELRPRTVVTSLVRSGDRIAEVRAFDLGRNEPVSFAGRYVILAAGALASPHLLLASRLQEVNSAGAAVGRYLTRHCAKMIFGFCNFRPDAANVFHKQLAVFDYYFGDRTRGVCQRLGTIQQITTPPAILLKKHGPPFLERIPLGGFMEHLTSVLVLSEDQPRASNGLSVDWADRDRFGLPRLCVTHRYSRLDVSRSRALVRRAKKILRRAGAWASYTLLLPTFSHAVGTVRMGSDQRLSPLDDHCRYRGLSNVLVVDGSSLPSGGAVNPSLTIAANALRAAELLACDG